MSYCLTQMSPDSIENQALDARLACIRVRFNPCVVDLPSMAEKLRIGDMLLAAGLINDFQLRRALSDQRQWRRPLGVTLTRMGFVSETDLMRVLSEQLHCLVADLDTKIAAPEVVQLVPYQTATKHHCLPLVVQRSDSGMELFVAMSDPSDLAALDDLGFCTGHKIRPVLVGDQQIDEAIQRSYRTGDPHGVMKQITLRDIETPGAPARPAEPEKTATAVELQLERPATEAPPVISESEVVLTETMPERAATMPVPTETPEPKDTIPASSPESHPYLLQALVQLLINEGMVDPNKLREMLRSITQKRS